MSPLHVVTMLNRLWPANWGPRMEGALRASVAALLEANTELPRDAQFTLLDAAHLSNIEQAEAYSKAVLGFLLAQ